jgi:phospholipid-translocating ATPase
MIPISLIVSLEVVKMCQGKMIEADNDLFDKKSGRRVKVVTCQINEELGQIEYIFSDKTGTLTCNQMEYKLGIIGHDLYGDSSILNEDEFKKHL